MASRILGMGGIVSLAEKARNVIDQKEAFELQKNMKKETFTLEYSPTQLQSVKKLEKAACSTPSSSNAPPFLSPPVSFR
jgi:signal recognition particle GTPase